MSEEKKRKSPARAFGKKGNYTPEEKAEAIKVLVENNYSLNKTSAQLGISRSSLNLWLRQYHNKTADDQTISIIEQNVAVNAARLKNNFLQKHYSDMSNLANKAIKRALELVEDEPDLNKVNNTIKIISDFVTKVSASENGEANETVRSGNLTLIEQTIMQLNMAAEKK